METESKVRCDSILHKLPKAQRTKLDEWLFAENHGCVQVAKQCQAEFGVEVHSWTVSRYRRREHSRWELEQKAIAKAKAEGSSTDLPDPETRFRRLLDKMIQIALETAEASDNPAERRVVSDYAKVLISSRREGHEALRAATTREKFEFDAATACLIHHAKIQAIAGDKSLDEGQQIQKVREELFGPNLPQ